MVFQQKYFLRYCDGMPIDPAQPKFFTGGVLREYQVTGYQWLKVSSINDQLLFYLNRRLTKSHLSRIYTGDFFACNFLIKRDVAELHLLNGDFDHDNWDLNHHHHHHFAPGMLFLLFVEPSRGSPHAGVSWFLQPSRHLSRS